MSAAASSPISAGNKILSALPRLEYPLLFSSLRPFNLDRGKIIYDLSDPINSVFFVMSGTVSLLATIADGSTTQVGMVGDEGVIGIAAILKIGHAPYQMIVQIPGRAMRVSAAVLVKEFNRGGPLQDILLRYVHSLICQLSQSAACNRFHSIEQRLCRWLLASQDRISANSLPLTQESLSHMLGATRTNVTKAASQLKSAGLIRYRHGDIHILDRPGLEKRSCECYGSEAIGSFRAA